jgi:hypothetical protein
VDGINNFISEIFFLTVAAHHYGTEAAQTKQGEIRKMVQRMEQELEKMGEERKKYTVSSHIHKSASTPFAGRSWMASGWWRWCNPAHPSHMLTF